MPTYVAAIQKGNPNQFHVLLQASPRSKLYVATFGTESEADLWRCRLTPIHAMSDRAAQQRARSMLVSNEA